MQFSIVFPAFNEELNIQHSIEEALGYLEGKDGEVLAVNDGSIDRTGAIIDEMARKYPKRVRAYHHKTNEGYSATLRDGFLAAQGEWIFYTDSDGQFVLKEMDRLLELSQGADIVVGYRMIRQDPWTRLLAAKVYNSLVRITFGLKGVRDIDCAFKLFHRKVFQRIQIESHAFMIDAEILLKAQKAGMVIREIGVTHLPRKFGESTVRFHHVLDTLKQLWKLRSKLRNK